MTCKECGKKVRGVPSPTGVCRKCRGLKSVAMERKAARKRRK